MLNQLTLLHFWQSICVELKNWSAWEVYGHDVKKFLHGQLTQDIQTLQAGDFCLSGRTTKEGRVENFCYLHCQSDQQFIVLLPPGEENLISSLDKFVIMEDVSFKERKESLYYYFGLRALEKKEHSLFFNLCGVFGALHFDLDSPFDVKLNETEFEGISALTGYPSRQFDLSSPDILLSETTLERVGISYEKGCFLGQETLAKIHRGRGARQRPAWLKLDNLKPLNSDDIIIGNKGQVFQSFLWEEVVYLYLYIERKNLINFLELETSHGKASVLLEPVLKMDSKESFVSLLFSHASRLYSQGETSVALELLDRLIDYRPEFPETYEAKSMILGNQKRYQEAIDLLDRLEVISPQSTLVHTNKSLFYMKIGKIELAEKEKEKALMKSMKSSVVEQKQKNIKKKEMFLQVLEIDQTDVVANMGLGNLALEEGEFSDAKKYFELIKVNNPKHSVAYLKLTEIYQKLGELELAIQTCRQGIQIATEKGELQPANKMHDLLLQLENRTLSV